MVGFIDYTTQQGIADDGQIFNNRPYYVASSRRLIDGLNQSEYTPIDYGKVASLADHIKVGQFKPVPSTGIGLDRALQNQELALKQENENWASAIKAQTENYTSLAQAIADGTVNDTKAYGAPNALDAFTHMRREATTGNAFSGMPTNAVGGATAKDINYKPFVPYDGNKIDDSQAGIDNKYKILYNEFREQGLSASQAQAIIGEINREGNFLNRNLFKFHIDPSKDKHGRNIINMGMISWNGSRQKKLQQFMASKGLLRPDGSIPVSEAGLRAQAQFMVREMQEPYYKNKMPKFFSNPNLRAEDYAWEVGGKYIVWAKGQKDIPAGNGKRIPFDANKGEIAIANGLRRIRRLTV